MRERNDPSGGRNRPPGPSTGLSNHDAVAFARSVQIEIVDFGTALPHAASGQVVCWDEGDGHLAFAAARRPDLSEREIWSIDQWVRQRAYLLALTLDPTFDGWHPHGRRHWQLTFRPDLGPPDPFPAEPLDWL